LTATLAAEGSYFVWLGDVQQKAGAAYAYRLRISEPRPDFALRVAPSSVNVRTGGNIPVTVYALRRDGFSQEISLRLKDAPKGFRLTGGRVPADKDEVQLTLSAPQDAPDGPVDLNIEGRAQVDGVTVYRMAVPAEDMMQAFAYRHLVPSKDMLVAVLSRGRGRIPAKLLDNPPVKLAAGKTTPVRFSAPNVPMANQVHLELKEPPDGVAIEEVTTKDGVTTIQVRTGAEKIKLGSKGNLIVEAFAERPNAGKAKAAARQQISLGTLPAIPFEIVKQP